ncbi:MAG: OmpH family outer membrane protein [Candidatus Omnitrophota bacterium]|nr:OmpH family outer membrane protein [Candidatus Omnitrophota bacterium]
MTKRRYRLFDAVAGMSVPMLATVVTCLMSHVACPIARADEFKLAYVNVGKLFDAYERTKASESVLEKKGKQKETEMAGRVSELKKLRESLELLNDKAREAKMREIEAKADELKRFRSNVSRDLRSERDEIAEGILKEIQMIVADYGKTNGFSLILDERTMLYGQATYDATDEILNVLNSRYKAKP